MKTKAAMLTGAMALVLIASGCEKKVGGQVVAIVNGQEVTQQELNAELNGQQIPPGVDKKAVMSQLLERVIERKLLVGKAKKDGLDQSPTYLAQVQRATDSILVELEANKIGKNLPLPSAAAADTFISENSSMFGNRQRYQLDQIVFPLTKDPVVVQKLGAAKTMEEVEAALRAGNIPYQTGKNAIDTAALPPQIAIQIEALDPGEPFLVPQNGQVIASVIRSKEAVPVSTLQARPIATQVLRRQALQKALTDQVKAERKTAQIEYGPGFAPPKNAPGVGGNTAAPAKP